MPPSLSSYFHFAEGKKEWKRPIASNLPKSECLTAHYVSLSTFLGQVTAMLWELCASQVSGSPIRLRRMTSIILDGASSRELLLAIWGNGHAGQLTIKDTRIIAVGCWPEELPLLPGPPWPQVKGSHCPVQGGLCSRHCSEPCLVWGGKATGS